MEEESVGDPFDDDLGDLNWEAVTHQAVYICQLYRFFSCWDVNMNANLVDNLLQVMNMLYFPAIQHSIPEFQTSHFLRYSAGL